MQSGDAIALTGLNLDYVDLSHAELCGGVTFENCSLRNAWFVGALLTDAAFRHCDLTNARFDDAELCGTDLRTAKRGGASFEGANTKMTIWTAADYAALQRDIAAQRDRLLEERPQSGPKVSREEFRAMSEAAGKASEEAQKKFEMIEMPRRLAEWRKARANSFKP